MSSKRRHTSKSSAPTSSSQEGAASAPPVAQYPSAEPRPVSRQGAAEVDHIGDILRRVREHRGEDLESISDYLRIRPSYLFALENSRYEDLPADAYVIGFLRSYATYLGLDGRGAIDQYRREMAGRRRKPQLSMPQPMPEGRAPTIAVLVGAAMAALLIYGIWYGLSSPDREALDKSIELPQTKQEEPATPTPSEPTSSEAAPAQISLPAQTATSDGISLAVPVTAVTTKSLSQPAADAPAAKTEASPEEPAKQATAPAKEAKDAKPAAKDIKDGKAVAPTQPATSTPLTPAPSPATAPLPPKVETAPLEPAKPEAATASADKGKARVTIKAEKESWVLVTDSKGNTIFDRTMKAGETYNVPSGKGLKLTTGNAEGVAFSVDGNDLPKLGSTDKVVRAIPLEPEKLKGRLTNTDNSTQDTPSAQ